MRPLHHPAIGDVTVEGILHALSEPVRVAIYFGIASADCAQSCSNFLKIDHREIPKSTLSQHFKVLREAGLIRSERLGVEMHNTTRCLELEERFPGLLKSIMNAHRVQLEEQATRARRAKRSQNARASKAA